MPARMRRWIGAALGVSGRNVVGSAQVERVVGDNHVDTGVDGLVDDGRHGVDGQEDACVPGRRDPRR